MTGVAGIEALVILLLLCALIYGQPAAVQSDRALLYAAQTQIARPVVASPTLKVYCPTPGRC